jgi:hypothetical protein
MMVTSSDGCYHYHYPVDQRYPVLMIHHHSHLMSVNDDIGDNDNNGNDIDGNKISMVLLVMVIPTTPSVCLISCH